MDDCFPDKEKLFRAIYPPNIREMFWKEDGSLSSAAFKDPNGLSVERSDFRLDEDVVNSMRQRFSGRIVSVTAEQCRNVQALIRYLPSKSSQYHSEIHGSETKKLLTSRQSRYLAKSAVIEYTEY